MRRDFLDFDHFYNLGVDAIRKLEIPSGVLASAKHEPYGCIFGRDSLITVLKLLSAYKIDRNSYYLSLTKKILEGLLSLQGREVNIESGEEPGKCIHEFRATGHEHLTKAAIPPWYLYPDGTMRNFDSVDATPLLLIGLYRYFQASHNEAFMNPPRSKRRGIPQRSGIRPGSFGGFHPRPEGRGVPAAEIKKYQDNIYAGLSWIFDFGDKNHDGFIDYEKHPGRASGGLVIQSWMDSTEAVFHEDGEGVAFPVSPVEAQAYTYLAFKLWSCFFHEKNTEKALLLERKAKELKELFNQKFVLGTLRHPVFAHALDNKMRPLVSARSSIGHVLWACLNLADDGVTDCIIDEKYIRPLVKRLMKPDLFEKGAGIRTLSKNSKFFEPMSYHNGSIWPHDNSIIAEGMAKLGFYKEAKLIRKALFSAYKNFQTPIELFAFRNGNFEEYKSPAGHSACHRQAWSAASMIADALALKSS